MQSRLENDTTSVPLSAITRWMTENGTQGVIVTDTDLRVTYSNRWIERQTGKSASEIQGKNLISLFPEIKERGLERNYEQALAGGSRVLSHGFHEYLLAIPSAAASPDVEWMQQTARVAPLIDDDKIIGTITIIEDVTDRVTRERELKVQIEEKERLLKSELAARQLAEENSRVKDEFLATVSHEIRSPLNAIRGWNLILRKQPLDPETFNHAIDTIDRNVVAQSELIEDLLDVSRMVTGQLNLEFETVDLVEVVNAAVDGLEPTAAAKELNLSRTIACDSSFVIADRERLQQILWNLLSNAIKFTKPKGSIEVGLLEDQNFATVTVRDDGIGIAADFLPYVFDRFRQGDGGRRRRHGGLGLGLSIVKNLVALHGGTVSVESPGEGMGSLFTVKLPRLALNTAEANGNKRKKAEPSAAPDLDYKILIVDDDDDSRETLRILLTMRQAEVAAARSAEEALTIFDEFRPNLIISDLGMPGMDGYDLIRQIRSLPSEKNGNVPALALTGYVSLEEQNRVRESGFDGHLAKPLDHEKLMKRIRELLDQDGG